MITDDELKQIMPRLSQQKRELYLPHLQQAMTEFEITTYLREAAFLAQIAHESGELRWMEEIADGSKYEGRADLGNTQPGDGRRFKGRGPIQLTGRANYREYGQLLGVDLIANPERAATPEVGFRTAGLYWKRKGLNELADQGTTESFREITRRINGGYNGWEDRLRYYERAKLVLSQDEGAQPGEEPTVRVVVNGREVPDVRPILRDGRTLVALRPIANAAGWRILSAAQGRAIIQDTNRENHHLTLLIENRTGYVVLRDLPGTINWDPATRTASLKTED